MKKAFRAVLRHPRCLAGLLLLVVLAAAPRWWLGGLGTWLDVGETPVGAEYVYVLGGGVQLRPYMALALARSGMASRVLVSHVALQGPMRDGIIPPEHEIARRILLRGGIASQRIILLGQDHQTTFDEARSLEEFLRGQPAETRVLVVTEAYHSRRSRWIFRQVLGELSPRVTFVSVPSETFELEHWWSAEAGFIAVTTENLKLGFYLLRYSPAPYVAAGVILLVVVVCRLGRKNRR